MLTRRSTTHAGPAPRRSPAQYLLALRVGVATLAAALLSTACGGGGSSTPAVPPSGGSNASTSPSAVLGSTHSGEGTYYDAVDQGTCMLGLAADHMTAAMNAPDYAGAAVCGEYAQVTGPKGQVTVRISDVCPECRTGDLDLSAEAFALIADPVAGRVPITWQVVTAPVSGPVQYRYKEGSTRYWTAVQVRNSRLPIARLQIWPTGASGWIDVVRTDYNYFVHAATVDAGPIHVRVTASTGAVVQDTLPEPQPGLQLTGQAQFN
jgi:expansin (peptidoglycan-binding protein)